MSNGKVNCPGCKKWVLRTNDNKYRRHTSGGGDPCDYGGTVITKEDECPSPSSGATATSAPSEAEGAPESASSATSTTASSLSSPEPGEGAQSPLPGAQEYVEKLNATATEEASSYRERVNAQLREWTAQSEQYTQPYQDWVEKPLFSQPAGPKSEQPAQEMGDFDRELTARLKELFYAYDNRRTADNRSAQATMGPSEMGTPCDRRLALSLMRMPPVNPGGDGWAAFVGTCIHAGLEQLLMWADAGTGRFAVEQRVEFDHPIVPKGTTDAIDRTLFLVMDHKCQGRWSRNKLKSQGPSKTYRVQAHVYAKGARLRGERVERVAIISWPRDEATLDDMYVWSEPYNPSIADAAFARVDEIKASTDVNIAEIQRIFPDAEELEVKARVGMNYQIADDCRYCPFYLPNSRDPLRGCNGKS